jgi:hypothetical protein
MTQSGSGIKLSHQGDGRAGSIWRPPAWELWSHQLGNYGAEYHLALLPM